MLNRRWVSGNSHLSERDINENVMGKGFVRVKYGSWNNAGALDSDCVAVSTYSTMLRRIPTLWRYTQQEQKTQNETTQTKT